MRHAGMLALVFTAGCSLVWSMDKYEGGSGTNARPGDDDGDGGGSGASTSSGAGGSSGVSGTSSSGATSSSGSSGNANDGGADAGKDANTCNAEPEPNGNASAPLEIPVGATCGAIVSPGDIDNYEVTTAASINITFELGPGIQVVINVEGAGDSDIFYTPGSHTKTFPAGTHSVIIETYDGTGGYRIIR